MQSSAISDGGVLLRIVANLLQFLDEDHNIFIIATVNNITNLPPELIRHGRWDKHWFFGLPCYDTRVELISLYMPSTDIPHIARLTDGFTCAEIIQIAKHTKLLYDTINTENVISTIKSFTPLHVTQQPIPGFEVTC